MKKKIIIFILIICIVFISIIAYKKFNNSNTNNEEITYDYTQYADKEVFYQTASSIYAEEKSDYEFKNGDTEKRIYIKVVDINKNPIKETRVAFYDTEGYFIMDTQANNNGEVAICGLENDTTYYCKQTQTKDGLIVDDTMYKLETTYKDTSFSMTMVNASYEMSKEERKEFIQKYDEANLENTNATNSSNTNIILSQQQIKENSAVQVKQATFFMLKDKLRGEKIIFSRYEAIRDDEKNLTKYILRIPNAEILNYEIEKLDDTENKVEILDLNKNSKTQFKDGEGFYLRYSPNDDIDDITYKFTITFKIDNEIYKIIKNFIIR